MSVDTAPRKPKTFRLPLELVSALEAAAEAREVPQTEIVENALRTALSVAEEGPPTGPEGLGGAPHTPGCSGDEPSTGESRAASAGGEVPPAATESPASPQPRDTVGFGTWLAGRTRMPHALCRAFVKDGRVRIAGEVCRDEVVPQARLLEGVTLDGEPV